VFGQRDSARSESAKAPMYGRNDPDEPAMPNVRDQVHRATQLRSAADDLRDPVEQFGLQ
jgi:hypothetical protein